MPATFLYFLALVIWTPATCAISGPPGAGGIKPSSTIPAVAGGPPWQKSG
jgi:hypothetical protein